MRNIGTLFGRPIGQYWEDLEIWENVLNYFDKRLHWIVELGTWEGGMSHYLHAQCLAREMWFMTLDIKAPDKPVPSFNTWNVEFGFPEWFTVPNVSPGIVFCDNGNKPAEVKLFVNLVHPESLIAVHDFGTEFNAEDIPESHRTMYQGGKTVFLARNDFINRIIAEEAKGKPIGA